MKLPARNFAIFLSFACTLLAIPGHAEYPVPPVPAVGLAPGAPENYDWDDLEVGEVLATGTTARSSSGETGCKIPTTITVTARLDPNGAIGTGKSLKTSTIESSDNPLVCQVVVQSKTILQQGPSESTASGPKIPNSGYEPPLDGIDPVQPAAWGAGGTGGSGGSGGSCGPTGTKGLHSDISEAMKNSEFKITARLKFSYTSCSVSVAGVSGLCEYNPRYGVMYNCSAGVATNENPVSYELWGSYGEDGSANVVNLHTKSNGYIGGGGGCEWSWSNSWEPPGGWQMERNCYWIDPNSV